MTRGWRRAQWLVPVVVALLAACAEPINGPTAAPAATPEPTAPAASTPEPTCEDSAIRLVDRGEGIHGAIVDDVLHMGGETASAACSAPVNQSLAGALELDGRTAQAQQSQYYLIVIRYPGGNRLYNISRRADGTTCVVDTNDQCIAQVTDLPDDFDLDNLPFDVEPTIPAGRPAPANDTPGDDAPPAAGDEAPALGTPSNPLPSDGATGVAVDVNLGWDAVPGALRYVVYWGSTQSLVGAESETVKEPRLQLPGLAHDKSYFWRVDAEGDDVNAKGDRWSFTTIAKPAVMTLRVHQDDRSFVCAVTISEGGVNPTVTEADCWILFKVELSKPVYFLATDNMFAHMDAGGTATSGRGMPSAVPGADYFGAGGATSYYCSDVPGRPDLKVCEHGMFGFPIYDDSLVEGDETIRVRVLPYLHPYAERSVPAGYPAPVCGRCSATVTIVDDD